MTSNSPTQSLGLRSGSAASSSQGSSRTAQAAMASPLASTSAQAAIVGGVAAPALSSGTTTPAILPHQRAISPPTPAPSPQPDARPLQPSIAPLPATPISLQTPRDEGHPILKQLARDFPSMESKDRQAFLTSLVDHCTARELAYLSSLISPRLKVDFLSTLPIEVSLQIISYMDLKSLARASGVSRFWRSLVNDEHTWKAMCDKYRFRRYAVLPSSSQNLGLETPDRSLQSMDGVDGVSSTESDYSYPYEQRPARNNSISDGNFDSNQMLSSLYETYIARGLDAASALSELKALHTLFLSKRAREMGVEERRRQLHALQSDGAFAHLISDRTALERIGEISMSQEDKQFYRALEEFVQEKRRTASLDNDGQSTGWLSTGPSSIRTMPGPPQTPSTARMLEQPVSLASVPGQHPLSSSFVSPTGRLGSMTSGLLTSFWDRRGSAVDSAAVSRRSTAGHTDGDVEMQEDRDAAQDEASSHLAGDSEGDQETSRLPTTLLGKGRPLWQHLRQPQPRAATSAERGNAALALGRQSPLADSMIGSATRRSVSTGTERANMSNPYRNAANRRSKPFSYKTHFKLAYLTESNWLRGGRLLTQHVSSDDASGEGPVVTTLSIDDEWIVVGMTNSKIHVFDAKTGLFVKTLVGHSSGVWCLSLISASASSQKLKGKGKSADDNMEEDEAGGGLAAGLAAYTYDNDRPFYTPTPDLNLIHHDPRPTATTFSPEMTTFDLSSAEPERKSMTAPLLSRMPKIGEPLPTWTFERADEAAEESSHFTSGAASRSSQHSSRGAGLGSNFGSPCGSVQGYGNPGAIVVSGGCDRDVRVWDLSTGKCKFVLSGHRSTVRCLVVLEQRPIAISGARDGTLRVWNIEDGTLVHTLVGHLHSVRCLDVAGNMVASASYDCSCRIWNVDTGKCVHVLRGHYHQIYVVAFDGVRVATGSLDSTVRVWSAETGECLALFQGHTSLVGQLQLNDTTLITGGSDGKVLIFSLESYKMLHQLMAHDNSVTCLQFDDRFIVTGGNDGKVKLWNFKTAEFVRELCEQSDQIWKIGFRDDKCVVLSKRKEKTAMDVISFRPIEETL